MIMNDVALLFSHGLEACFEQGSLPSMLHLFGEALLCVLPGDRMFQAQQLVPGRSRPVILHGYGRAKRDIPVRNSCMALVRPSATVCAGRFFGSKVVVSKVANDGP